MARDKFKGMLLNTDWAAAAGTIQTYMNEKHPYILSARTDDITGFDYEAAEAVEARHQELTRALAYIASPGADKPAYTRFPGRAEVLLSGIERDLIEKKFGAVLVIEDAEDQPERAARITSALKRTR